MNADSGILPRTAHLMYTEMKRLHNEFGKKLDIYISSLEIYCEQVKDLFSIVDQSEIQKVSKDIKVIRSEKKRSYSKTKTAKNAVKVG